MAAVSAKQAFLANPGFHRKVISDGKDRYVIGLTPKENIQKRLLQWYKKNKRDLPWRKTRDPYAIWVSEIMLQQTQVETVIPYYQKFLESFPTVRHLAKSDLSKVLKVWEGMGYYSRARNLHRASKIIVNRFQGKVPDNLRIF